MQQIGLIGVGKMGKELARRLKNHVDLTIYDRDPALLEFVGSELSVHTAKNMEDLAAFGTIILAVPDPEVINCIKDYNQLKIPLNIISVATNVAQHALEETAAKNVRCIGAKFVGHADEMALGLNPVIIVNDDPFDLAILAESIFSGVGKVFVGKTDIVSFINTMAAEKALEAAVYIEDGLFARGIKNPVIIRSAIRQVAAGVMKAYADEELGPFARQIVRSVRAKQKSGDK